jgi:16S rRNA (cytidine1402-2'-O)-methyltransferase
MATLYLVATPIGNLEDITRRAQRVLAEVALVAAEDTRHSGLLLRHLGLHKPLLSLHEHNEAARIPTVLAALDRGEDVALISDAGTPGLSDPGYRLVQAVWEAGHRVVPVPGASALLAALVASGLPTDRFLFLGFPPRKAAARAALLREVAAEPGTLVFFEAPTRLPAFLQDIAAVLGPERPVVVARELTKIHESFWRGTAAAAVAAFAEPPPGEIVVLVGGAPAAAKAPSPVATEVEAVLRGLIAGGMTASEAARRLARLTGLSRRELYRLAQAGSPTADGA